MVETIQKLQNDVNELKNTVYGADCEFRESKVPKIDEVRNSNKNAAENRAENTLKNKIDGSDCEIKESTMLYTNKIRDLNDKVCKMEKELENKDMIIKTLQMNFEKCKRGK